MAIGSAGNGLLYFIKSLSVIKKPKFIAEATKTAPKTSRNMYAAETSIAEKIKSPVPMPKPPT
jgi:hypothetical protein